MAELYHYTTGAGLIGMLKDYDAKENPNLTMWATHYAYMNDPTELDFGKNICLPLIKEIEAEENIPKQKQIYDMALTREYIHLQEQYEQYMTSNADFTSVQYPFIISFSQAKDSLHMWGMYGQNGNGLALCFDSEKLKSISPRPCWYLINKDEDILAIKNLVKEKYFEIERTMPVPHVVMNAEVYLYLTARTFSILSYIYSNAASYIKNKSYAIEKEWRFIFKNTDQIFFREKRGEIIPYIKCSIPFDALKNIIVGPTRSFERTRDAIIMLLNQKDISWFDSIIKSEVPYKG